MTDVDVNLDGGTKKPALEIKNGSTTGLIITVLIGFVLYFILGSVQHVGQWFPYDQWLRMLRPIYSIRGSGS